MGVGTKKGGTSSKWRTSLYDSRQEIQNRSRENWVMGCKSSVAVYLRRFVEMLMAHLVVPQGLLDTPAHLCMRMCPSVRPSVHYAFVRTAKTGWTCWKSLLFPWGDHESRFKICQSGTQSVNCALNQSLTLTNLQIKNVWFQYRCPQFRKCNDDVQSIPTPEETWAKMPETLYQVPS